MTAEFLTFNIISIQYIVFVVKLELITTFHMYIGSLFYSTTNNYFRIKKFKKYRFYYII